MSKDQTRIDRSCVMNLYNSIVTDLSPHSVGQWLKVTTDNEYVVVPKDIMSQLASGVSEMVVESTEMEYRIKELENWL